MSVELFESIMEHLFRLSLLDRNEPSNVWLFSWGEPLLHPQINEILRSLKKMNAVGVLSSNFINMPHLDKELFPVLKNVTLSLSGFSQQSYEKIHGGRLRDVLNNFDRFYDDIRRYSPTTRIMVSWHRYKFNEDELWAAYEYFDREQVYFRPETAFLDDVIEMLRLLSGKRSAISEPRWKKIEEDVFVEHIVRKIDLHRKKSKEQKCEKWDELNVDEKGQLLLCTGIGNNDTDHVLGNVLDMSAEQIWENKLSDSLCNDCISTGLCRFLDLPPFNQKPLPRGGGLSQHKLHFVMGLILAKCKTRHTLAQLKHGEEILEFIEHYRRKMGIRFFGMNPQ